MSETKEMTLEEISSHNSKKDLYLVIHDKVYDATNFIDEHPGGEEVLLDVGGQDATEAFEDVGHSDEARSILEGLKAGELKRKPGEPEVSKEAPATSSTSSVGQPSSSSANDAGMGIMFYALVLLGGGLAFGAYKYLQAKSASEGGK
ncbi:MAG: hypothetical protein Q9216_002316 [Gyalolechia sp. 2 TL-2023]